MKIKIEVTGEAGALRPAFHRDAEPSVASGNRGVFSRHMRALLRRGEQGQSMVEFALILPMMLLITTGIFVFGIAMNNYLQLTNAVSIGARAVANSAQMSSGGTAADPCAVGAAAIAAAAPGLNAANLSTSFVFNGNPAVSGPSCASSATELSPGTSVTVTAQYPLNLSVFGQKYSASNAVLQASSTELAQ
jgi:Flp pilus assembly protein TadG